MTWKKYRIVRKDLLLYKWKIQERYTIFFFIHWWGDPSFAPPHRFENYAEAVSHIYEEIDNPKIVDLKE